jgi:hypothetical protein
VAAYLHTGTGMPITAICRTVGDLRGFFLSKKLLKNGKALKVGQTGGLKAKNGPSQLSEVSPPSDMSLLTYGEIDES